MDRTVRNLLLIALLSFGALCLAWWREDDVFAAVFAVATVMAVLAALRGAL
jgi:hypothetical protein